MKKNIVFLFSAALAVAIFVLVFKPDLLDQLRGTTESSGEEELSVTEPQKEIAPAPSPVTAPKNHQKPLPKEPTSAAVLLDRLADRSIYVNGADQTGELRCQVTPGKAVVVTWESGRYSHELIDIKAGEDASPEAGLKTSSASPAWEGFQGGPERTGQVQVSSRSGFKKRWEGRLEDEVRSSPVIHGGTAFFATDTCFVRAVELETGRLLWSRGIVGNKVNPVVVGDFVFAGDSVGLFEGIRVKKGKPKGTTSLGSGLAGLTTASDDLLLASTSGGMLLAIATRANMVGRLPLKFQWDVTVPGFGGSTATPLVLEDRAILQTTEGELLAVSVADGSMIWPAGKETIRGVQAVAEPGADMTFRFVTSQGFLTPTPAASGNVIYAANRDRIKAVSAADGALLWEREFDGQAASSVSLAWGTIYLGCTDGSVRAFSCEAGVPIFRAQLGENPIFSSPVLFDGQILAATGEGKLFLLDAFSGTILAEDHTLGDTPIDATPAVWPGGILVINRDGVMVCFE